MLPSTSLVPAWKTSTPSTALARSSPAMIFPDSGRTGIAASGHHDADARIGAPAEDAVADAAFDAGLEGFEQIAVQAHQDGLGLRVSETAVELQHLWSAGGHHEATVEDSGVWRSPRRPCRR